MKSVTEQLTSKERLAIALWYETESYKALRKLIDLERLSLAKDHVNEVDLLQIRHLSGQSTGLKKLVGTIRQVYKESNKKS